jgi:hypothetical protein
MEAFLIFPKMSNVASPPAEPGVYLMANYTKLNFLGVLSIIFLDKLFAL